MKVYVYYNIRKRMFSVKALEGEHKGKVIRHDDEVVLEDVTFKVSEAGRQRVLRDEQKNVHAGAVGTMLDFEKPVNYNSEVTYNPYYTNTFILRRGCAPVHKASNALMTIKSTGLGSLRKPLILCEGIHE